MPIETICQGCGERLRVADEHVGRTARCPNCRSLYTVPKPQAVEPHAAGFAGDQAQFSGASDGRPPASALLAGLPDDLFYVRWGGRSFGPISRDELLAWHADGRLPPDASVQREGLAAVAAADLFPPPSNAADAAAPAVAVAPAPMFTRHQGGLVLALGVASLGSICSCFLVMPVLAIIALAVGIVDLQKMQAGITDPRGKTQVIVGMVLAGIAIVVFAGYMFVLFR
jgi:hypothetical protein